MAGYGDDIAFAEWLQANGYSPPDGAPTAAVLRQRGAVYVDGTYGLRFPGAPAGGAAQEREWPRTGATDRYGNAIDPAIVPARVIEASYFAAYQEASEPGSLSVAGTIGSRVKREKVEGAVEVEYQASGSNINLATELTPILTTVEGILSPLLATSILNPGVMVV